MKVGIIGAGAWGTALAICAARGGTDVVLWSRDGQCAHFDGVEMPAKINLTSDISELADMDAWLIATPAAFFEETLTRAREYYRGVPIVICTKGADPKTGDFTSEMLARVLPSCTEYGVLSGPQFAGEVAASVPTGSTIAGTPAARHIAHDVLKCLFLEDSDDIIGTQICGVGKNAVALICGYLSIAGSGENERAMTFTRAWGEVMNIGMALGAQMRTFLSLCGIGDLFLSATSETSRNFSGGMAIARGMPPAGTVEGIFALRGLVRRAAALGVETPILNRLKECMKI